LKVTGAKKGWGGGDFKEIPTYGKGIIEALEDIRGEARKKTRSERGL